MNIEKDSKKLLVKQIQNCDDSRSIAETTSADIQNRQVLEAVQWTAASPELALTRQSKDTGNQLPAPEINDLLIRQAEAVRLSQVTNEIYDESAKIAEYEDAMVVDVDFVTEVKPFHSSALLEETSEMAVRPPVEEESQPIFMEEISEFSATQSDVREQLSPKYFVDEVEQTEILISFDEPFYETADGQACIEPAQLVIAEGIEPVEHLENSADYEFLGEDEVILLMANFEQIKAYIDEAGDPTPGEIFAANRVDTKVFRHSPAESQTVVSIPELPAPVKEIETVITQLAETLELAEDDEAQKVYQILEEIITLPDTLEASTGEAEKDVELKLEELFTRLFEQTGVEYAPELIESFVKLTQAHYLNKLLPIAIEMEDDVKTLSGEIGTREFLQKLQHGLSTMKQAVIHFYEIGKSVLRLYGLASAVPVSTPLILDTL